MADGELLPIGNTGANAVLHTWDKARILASISLIKGGVPGIPVPISIVNRVVTDVNTPYEAGHSINQYNSHVIEKPPEYTFTIAISSISDEVELLRDIQSSGIYFQMELRDENDDSGNQEYKLCREYFRYCKLTRKRAEIVVGETPMVIYDGIALEYSYDFWKAGVITPLKDGNDNQYWFGHGDPIPSSVNLFANWETA